MCVKVAGGHKGFCHFLGGGGGGEVQKKKSGEIGRRL